MTKTTKVYLRFLHQIAYLLGIFLLFTGLSFPISSNTIGIIALKEADPQSLRTTDFTHALLNNQHLASAELIQKVHPDEALATSIYNLTLQNPTWQYAGTENAFFETVFDKGEKPKLEGSTPIHSAQLMIKRINRQWMKTLLSELNTPAINTILTSGLFQGWKILEPIESSASAPLDTAILTTALLQYEGALTTPLQQELLEIISNHQDSANMNKLESFYLSMLTYSQKYSWDALVQLARNTTSMDAWILGSQYIREYPDKTALIFTASLMAESFPNIVNYLDTHEKPKALEDLNKAVLINQGAVKTLLSMNRPLFEPRILGFIFTPLSEDFMAKELSSLCIYKPSTAIKLKYISILVGSIFLINAIGLSFIKRKHESIAHALHNQPYINYLITAFTITLILAFILEPSSAPENEPTPPPIFISFSLEDLSHLTQSTIMNTYSLDTATTLTLLGFFLVQAIIYALALRKLRQIQEKKLSNEKKLQVLENEENFFDLGLYIGLAGTVASLMLLALGIVGTSLIAAYSSTLFGIIAVALVKIIHIRPYRQMLILNIK